MRQGRGSVEGANLARHGLINVRGFYRDSVLVGRGVAVLAPGSMWDSHEETVQLEGVFNDGYLEGPVRGLNPSGGLVFVGQYRKAWLPDGYSRIFKSYVFGPSGFWTMAPLRCAAKFDPFLSLDCAPTPSTLAQS